MVSAIRINEDIYTFNPINNGSCKRNCLLFNKCITTLKETGDGFCMSYFSVSQIMGREEYSYPYYFTMKINSLYAIRRYINRIRR